MVFDDEMADGVLWRAEESFRESKVDHCDLGGAFDVRRGEFAADKNGLAQGGEITRSDIGRFKIVVFVFGEGVAFNDVAVHLFIAGEFRVGGGCGGDDAGNSIERVHSAGDDLRSAIFAVARVGGIEAEGRQVLVSKPTGWLRRLSSVWTKSPAAPRRRTLSAICTPTATLRNRCEPLEAVPALWRRASTRLGRMKCSTGARLKRRLTRTEIPRVKNRTRESITAE